MHFQLVSVVLASTSMATASTIYALEPPSLSERSSKFSCDSQMAYSPWTRSCSCVPGKYWSKKKRTCVGTELTGAWPEPSTSIFSDDDGDLDTFCATSPYKIVQYDKDHEYCQVNLDTVTFCATSDIKDQIGDEIDLDADISDELKNIVAGLNALYLEDVKDAVKLYNTDDYGLAAVVGSLTCELGLSKDCNKDCVKHCEDGCGNQLDVIGDVGGLLEGLVGFCLVPGVVKTVNSVGNVVGDTVASLLCTVGGLLGGLLGKLDCDCGDGGDDDDDDDDDGGCDYGCDDK